MGLAAASARFCSAVVSAPEARLRLSGNQIADKNGEIYAPRTELARRLKRVNVTWESKETAAFLELDKALITEVAASIAIRYRSVLRP